MKQNDYDSYAESMRDIFLDNGLTLAVAESVTCGHLQAAFAHLPDTSRFFQGGITAYNLGQKVRHLGVEPIGAEQENCVSEPVAIQMAFAVTRMFLRNIGIGVTGYASPLPEKGIYTLFAHFAVVKDGTVLVSEQIGTRQTDPVEVQKDYCRQILKKTRDALKK